MITISEAQRLGRLFFNLDFPCTEQEFKSAFRAAARALHPDLTGQADGQRFVAMKTAYDQILEMAEHIEGFFKASVGDGGHQAPLFRKTVEGILLAELGLGLGPTKNGQDCPECQHKGYTEYEGTPYRVCTECDEVGTVPGQGNHTGYRFRCPHCRGFKTIYEKKKGIVYKKCFRCSGTGELPVFNPVIIKGALRA